MILLSQGTDKGSSFWMKTGMYWSNYDTEIRWISKADKNRCQIMHIVSVIVTKTGTRWSNHATEMKSSSKADKDRCQIMHIIIVR